MLEEIKPNPTSLKLRGTRKSIIKILLLVIFVALLIGGGYFVCSKYFTKNTNKSVDNSSELNNQVTSSIKQTDNENTSATSDFSANIKFQNLSTQNIDGASLWLFAVPDDNGQVILSTESNGSIKMAKFDINNPTQKPTWKTIISNSDIGGKGVADHWHEFANGYHWLAFSISEAITGYALKVDRDLNKVKLAKIADKITLKEGEVPFVNPMNPYLPTNDMFLVPDDSGVTAGFYLPGTGHRLFRLDSDLNLLTNKDIGGGNYAHGNGSSALKDAGGFNLIAVDNMNQLQQGGLNLIKFNSSWEAQSKTTLVDIDKTNIGMASGVYTDQGTLIINARVYEGAYSKGEMPPPPSAGASLAQDGGKIKRFVFDSNYNLISTEEIYSQGDANRPHTSIIGEKLLTTWDAGGKTYLRIDKISY